MKRWLWPSSADIWLMIGVMCMGIVCAGISSLVPPMGILDIGTTYAQPYLEGFHGLERNPQFSYSFTKEQAIVTFPGIGSSWTTLVMRANGYRPEGIPPAELFLATSETEPIRLQLRSDPARYYLLLPPGDDDLRIQLTSTTFTTPTDPRRLGVAIDWIAAYQLAYGWPFWQALYLALIGGLGYWLLRRVAVERQPATVITLAALITLGGLLASFRIWWAIFTPMLVGLLVGLHLCLGPLRAFTRFAFARGGETLPQWHETWLWRIVLLAALIKIGGVIYPQTIVYDERWHVPRTQMVLDGRFLELVVPSPSNAVG